MSIAPQHDWPGHVECAARGSAIVNSLTTAGLTATANPDQAQLRPDNSSAIRWTGNSPASVLLTVTSSGPSATLTGMFDCHAARPPPGIWASDLGRHLRCAQPQVCGCPRAVHQAEWQGGGGVLTHLRHREQLPRLPPGAPPLAGSGSTDPATRDCSDCGAVLQAVGAAKALIDVVVERSANGPVSGFGICRPPGKPC